MSRSEETFTIPDDLVDDPRMAELGDACEGFLLDSAGKFDPPQLDVRRKSFCQFLGIGESTFTGWVQAGRIPRSAAIAFVLHRNLRQRTRRIRELMQERLEPRVVVVEGKFAICEFLEREDGKIEGHLVATGISDEGVAHDLARHRSRAFSDLQARAIDALRFYQESDPDQLEWVGEVVNELENYKDPDRRRKLLSELLDIKGTSGGSPAEVDP